MKFNKKSTSSTAGKSPEDNVESRITNSTLSVKSSILDNDFSKDIGQSLKHKILTLSEITIIFFYYLK